MKKALVKAAANEKGAASVLVIFMLLVLVTLGAIAITSANVNFKLNRRTVEWNEMYYELDGRGEEFLAALDGKLAKAERNAADYIRAGGYKSEIHAVIPEEAQKEIFTLYGAGEMNVKEAFDKIYMYYADIFVTELLLDFPELQVYSQDNGVFTDSLLMEMNIKSERSGYELCGLVISLWAEPLECDINEADGLISKADGSLRYMIEDWYEYQEPLGQEEEEPATELWDGSL